MKRYIPSGIALLFATGATCHGAVLMGDYPPGGSQQASTRWTNLTNTNSSLAPDPGRNGGGTILVASPGYKASIGFYSYVGHYSFTTAQTSSFDIQNVVFQFEASVNESFPWPHGVGPTLTISTSSGMETVLPVAFASGNSEMRSTFGELEYTAYAWQWDLSSYADTITAVSILTPVSVHTSVMAAQIDVSNGFSSIGAVPEPSSSLLCLAGIAAFAIRRQR